MAALSITIAQNVCAQNVSPHGFNAPECTWAADIVAAWRGWNLDIRRYPQAPYYNRRDAWMWYDIVTGVGRGQQPRNDSILVFGSNAGLGSNGHVAYIMTVPSGGVGRMYGFHSNWPLGITLNYDAWDRRADGWVRRVGESRWRPVRGYLYHP